MILTSQFWIGVAVGPIIWILGEALLKFLVRRLIWLGRVVAGSPLHMWPLLWMVSYALPKLGKDYAYFLQANGRRWVSPRVEKFRILPRPEDLQQ